MTSLPPVPLVREETPLGIRVKAVGRKGNAFLGKLVKWDRLGVTVQEGDTKVQLPAHRILGVYEVKP